VRQLIEAGADVNKRMVVGSTSLFVAVSCGNVDLVRLLLASGANRGDVLLEAYAGILAGATPLMVAVQLGLNEVAELLFERRRSPRVRR